MEEPAPHEAGAARRTGSRETSPRSRGHRRRPFHRRRRRARGGRLRPRRGGAQAGRKRRRTRNWARAR
eukprot:7705001-Lingulodinium_polyedra.AAC.1